MPKRAAAQVWPLASQINYQHVPLHLRVLFVNVVAFFWCARARGYI